MLQDSLRTTIGLDESVTTLHQAEIAVDLRSAGAFCVKPGRVGGLGEAKAIHDAALASDIDCYAGSDILTSVGYRFVAALASLPGFRLPADYLRLDEYLTDDPGVPLRPVLKKEPPKKQPGKVHESVEHHLDDQGNMVAEKVIPYTGPNILEDNQRLVLELWNEPGIGFEPNLELIERFAIQHCAIPG
jgi:L-alanine-DL-glutamate epimerase-like enolase superfamily enzyme